jgi:hypothetical protein
MSVNPKHQKGFAFFGFASNWQVSCCCEQTTPRAMQRSPEKAADFCRRRVAQVKKQLDELGEEIQSKQNAAMQINQLVSHRMREAGAASAQTASKS